MQVMLNPYKADVSLPKECFSPLPVTSFFNVNSRASLVAQTVRSLAAVQEPWAQSLSGDGPLEKELAL